MTVTDPSSETEQRPRSRWFAPVDLLRSHPWIIAFTILLTVALSGEFLLYRRYDRIVSRTLARGPFSNASNIFSAPRVLSPGEVIAPESIISGLVRAGYSASQQNGKGWFRIGDDTIEVHPGRKSYFQVYPALIRFKKGKISELVSLDTNARLDTYQIEPELLANLVDKGREKRRLVTYAEIPPALVKAVISTEDKRFFQHAGFDPLRLVKAAYIDARSKRKEQGASTITMQLARGLWLHPEKRWRRKFSELMITLVLEHRLTKEQIFQYYANQVYLGRSDSFSVHGFGEAAQTFFGKDISQITVPEAALLAGLIQRPSYFNPVRYPKRATERRNLVLRLMKENRYLSADEYARAASQPLHVIPQRTDGGDAPYFLALMNDELQDRLGDNEDATGLRIYTTLDPELQRAAQDAVRVAMPKVDAIVKRRKIATDGVLPQVALIALDPHTGEVKAIVGGRDYGESQLNHVLTMRQPGSIFKPFVYVAALSTALDAHDPAKDQVFTPATTVVDEPITFHVGDQVYEPSNFEKRFYGTVTLRTALAKSMNLATLTVAEKVGYNRVVDFARLCGLNDKILPTPAMALGSYDASPLEMAGAYTAFANDGVYVRPTFLTKAFAGRREVVNGRAGTRRAFDPRVAWLINNMLQEVMRTGTGASASSFGFKAPAAGKTGTAHDGWFAGYTPNLLCIVWVGFDDYRKLEIEGAKSALPVWAEFMKRAVAIHPVQRPFDPPPQGIVGVQIDPATGLLESPECGPGRTEYFMIGTEPTQTCQMQDLLHLNDGVILNIGEADRDIEGAAPGHR